MNVPYTFEAALSLHRRGNVAEAANIYARLVKDNPGDSRALHYLGLVYMQSGNLSEASTLMERSLNLDPANANALNDYGILKERLAEHEHARHLFDRALKLNDCHVDALSNMAALLMSQRMPYEALPYLERLSALQPNSLDTIVLLAQVCLELGHAERAINGLRSAIHLEPGHVRARLMLGKALESLGRFTQARAMYLAVLRREENNVAALAKLLCLRDGKPGDRWVDKARRLLDSPTMSKSDRSRLRIALGQYHDRIGEYEKAFENVRIGCELRFSKAPFNSLAFSDIIDRLMSTFSSELISSVPQNAIDSDRPIFIVGMPRSGTTLLEQMLASHSKVEGGGELTAIMTIDSQIHSLGGGRRPYPEGIRDLHNSDLVRLAKQYLHRLDRVSQAAARVTDKQPFNFLHLGLIAMLFPQASIVHCRRDPLDTCVSCYFTGFAEEFQFANNLKALGQYYCDYHRLMEHWHKVLPHRILDVQYEELVTDPAKTVREVLKHCKLEWEAACLSYQDTQRPIQTPSTWQIRQPIYTASIGRWANYRQYLKPLEVVLSSIAH